MQVLEMRRGDTKQIDVQILDTDGEPYLVNEIEDIFFTVKARLDDDDDDAIIFKSLDAGIEITDEPTATATITVDPADTSGVEGTFKGLHWDIQMVTTDDKVYTISEGTINIISDVTNRIVA